MTKNSIKNWLVLFILLVVFASPFFLAKWFFYTHGSDVVENLGTINKGTLIQPTIALSQVSKTDIPQVALKHKWYILYVFDSISHEEVKVALDKIQRIRLALGKDFSQVGAVLGLSEKNHAHLDYIQQMQSSKKNAIIISEIILSQKGINRLLALSGEAQGIFIMDPEFNIMMFYPANVNSENIYKDLQRLLKYSGSSSSME